MTAKGQGLPRAELVAVGSELTEGARLDTNTAWLRQRLAPLRLQVARVTAVPDRIEEIRDCLQQAGARSHLLVITGGLGPTDDDRTLEAMAEATGLRRELHPEVLQALTHRRGRPLGETDEGWLRQARLPRGARALANSRGTAPAVVLEAGACLMVALPGVPDEMHGLWADHLEEMLLQRFGASTLARRRLLVGGRRESDVDNLATPICRRHGIELTVLTGGGTVDLLLQGEPQPVAAAAEQLVAGLGPDLVAADGRSLEETVLNEARQRQGMLAVAESCTGGRIAARLTAVPGASSAFAGGVVAYSDELKRTLLEVPGGMLAAAGAVSEEVALAMAEGLRRRTGCRWGLAVTGIAGPEGGTPAKPVGTVWFAVVSPGGETVLRRQLPGGRDRIQELAAGLALDLLRRAVLAEVGR